MAGSALSAATMPSGLKIGLALVLGACVFLVRPYTSLDPFSAPLLLAGLYLALYAVSVGPVVPSDAIPAPLGRWVVFGTGAAAVIALRLLADPIAPADRRLTTVALSILASVAEEAYFRRLAYGSLVRFGAVAAIFGSAIAFSLMHYPGYGAAALPLDLGAGLLFGWQRWASGSWTVAAGTHTLANLLSAV